MNFLVPTELETERLLLRQFRESDLRDLHAYYSDPVATKFTGGPSLTETDTWYRICSMIGHWQIRGYGPYAVEEKISATVLGPVGFWYPNDWPEPEIKWALAAQHCGKGFAKEAAIAVHSAGRTFMPEIKLISLIHPDNLPSIQLALAVGAHFEKTIDYEDGPYNIYRHSSATQS